MCAAPPRTPLDIVNAVEGDQVIMIPDQYLARNTAKKTQEEDRHLGRRLRGTRDLHRRRHRRTAFDAYPGAKIIAHPECPPEVIDAVDFSGSTAGMIDWVKTEKPAKVVMVTDVLDVRQCRGRDTGRRILEGL